MSMAMADGKLEPVEYQFLLKVAQGYGITEKEVEALKNNIIGPGLISIDKSSSKFQQIYDLIKMMMIDDEINPNELRLCKKFAEKVGYSESKVDEIIEAIVQNISNGNSLEETKIRLGSLIDE
jgi:uncharacterized tellurite resistance protein B-like protein